MLKDITGIRLEGANFLAPTDLQLFADDHLQGNHTGGDRHAAEGKEPARASAPRRADQVVKDSDKEFYGRIKS